MGYTLIVNTGSSSKKYSLYSGKAQVLAMRFERTEEGFEICTNINQSRQKCEGMQEAQFKDALEFFIDTARTEGIIEHAGDIDRACIRVVAPGTMFQKHRIIDEQFIIELQDRELMAPLHIPVLLREISVLKRTIPQALLVAASDSAFHASMPELARSFSIPQADADEHDIYRFGYHGISIASVLKRIPAVLSAQPHRLIVCHLGSGASITAIKDGKSVDTSMGYAPGGGLVMGTRAGDLETEALIELMRAKHMRFFDAHMYLQTQGGLYGLTGQSDLRRILEQRSQAQKDASYAFSKYVYHIQKTIGSYIAILGGLDALVLTATASERNPQFRSLVLNGLQSLGIEIDAEKNDACIAQDQVISAPSNAVTVAVIRTDEAAEMLRIAESF